MKGLLSGVRVLDLTRMLAGPYGTMILGDLGAEVIKIEDQIGDFTRYGGHVTPGGVGTYFLSINRNKKSVVLDLKRAEGREVFYDLVRISDVVMDNMRPEALRRLKCDYEDLKPHNPRIISCSLSGFGRYGPYRDRPAFDLTVQALSGAMGLTGQPDGEPCRMGLPVGDVSGGMFAVIAILAGLQYRNATGEGRKLDVSLLDGLISMTTYLSAYYFMTGEDPGPQGSRHELIVPYEAFPTRDIWIVVTCVTPKFWEGFCRALEVEELITDERFDDPEKRRQNHGLLIPILRDVFSRRTGREWLERLEAEEVPCAPVNTLARALEDPQVLERNMVVTVPHPRAGDIRVAGNPIKAVGLEERFESPPELGGQTREVLADLLNYTEERINQLETEKVIGIYREE
ncbi:MAG: CoA transferase [Proteobacteria bacterium]|nr:CoA transferase [Pseudomonadota bacterium]